MAIFSLPKLSPSKLSRGKIFPCPVVILFYVTRVSRMGFVEWVFDCFAKGAQVFRRRCQAAPDTHIFLCLQ